MTKLPEIPTDNLYKFIAISGLVLMITILSFFYLNNKSNEKYTYDLEYEKVILNNDTLAINSSTKLLSNINIDNLTASEIINIQDKVLANKIKKNDLTKDFKNKESLIKSNNVYNTIFSWIGVLFILTVCFGFIIFGFIFWYRKLQRFLDIKVLYEAKGQYLIKESQAFDSLNEIYYYILPQRLTPYDDWHDALGELQTKFVTVEKLLLKYLKKFTSTISKEEINEIQKLISISSSNKFPEEQYDVAKDKETEDFLKIFQEIMDKMYKKINKHIQ